MSATEMTNVAMSGNGTTVAFLVRDLEDTFVQVYQNNLNLSNDQKILRGQRIIISTIGNRILDASVAINNDGSRVIVGNIQENIITGVKTSAVDVYEYTYFTTHSEWVAICSRTPIYIQNTNYRCCQSIVYWWIVRD